MVNYSDFLNCTVGNASIEYAHCLEDVPAYEDCADPSLCVNSSGSNVGLAFGLTIAAGLATTLGALLPFLSCIKPGSKRYLAAAMALAAGVMLYVSFTDIRVKTVDHFCCVSPLHSELFTTLCFFGGILLTVLLDLLVWWLQKVDCGCGSLLPHGRAWRRKGQSTVAENEQAEKGGKHWAGGEKERAPVHAVNGELFNSLDDSALIEESSLSRDSAYSTSQTMTSLEKGSDVAVKVENATQKSNKVLEEDEGIIIKPSQASTG